MLPGDLVLTNFCPKEDAFGESWTSIGFWEKGCKRVRVVECESQIRVADVYNVHVVGQQSDTATKS